MKTVVFLLSHVPNPRMNKRIGVAKEVGTTALICVRRKSANIWEPYHLDIENTIFDMDMPDSSNILYRIRYSILYAVKAIKKLRTIRPSCIYTEGLDSLLISVLYSVFNRTKIIYEVADLRKVFIEEATTAMQSIKSNVVKFIEKVLLKKVKLLVLTSDMFFEKYYKKIISKDRVLFIPNMPDLSAFKSYIHKENGRFTVGFIGGIRYLNQMKMLVDAAESQDVSVLFAGAGGTQDEYIEITNYCSEKQFVDFFGKYNYNNDIAQLYGRVDCVYAVYDADNANVRIALPNKLYEAIYCELPIIVAKGTYLAELVEKWGVGVAVSHTDLSELEKVLHRLSTDKEYYEYIVKNCRLHKADIDIELYNQKLLKQMIELIQ
ncbi:glycosyltransferase [Ruminiclostridium herbifermentans]|uniref:Glycosyltransferase n=1 Tax=Ruminiclostridium herbifermentans TaxID=2488810 RepID=A0A7H1VN39_9FIRM|nr:glycosyltransferase [Ruminiclostridium herbifermentans]QNU66801.1 glycosyltransferase [Ruminiclostridium herbifermentans]